VVLEKPFPPQQIAEEGTNEQESGVPLEWPNLVRPAATAAVARASTPVKIKKFFPIARVFFSFFLSF
jgi:hypothetical protein